MYVKAAIYTITQTWFQICESEVEIDLGSDCQIS